MAFISRDLEGAGPSCGKSRDHGDINVLGDRGVKRHVHMGRRLQHFAFGLEQLAGGHRIRLVIGHVDNGGDAARGGGPGQVFEPGETVGRPGVDLAVDDAREYEATAEVLGLSGGGWVALAEGRDFAVGDRDVAIGQNPIGQDQIAPDQQIMLHERIPLPNRADDASPLPVRTSRALAMAAAGGSAASQSDRSSARRVASMPSLATRP